MGADPLILDHNMATMPGFEVETWKVKPSKEKEHEKALRGWFTWVNEHRTLFPEWKSVRYFVDFSG